MSPISAKLPFDILVRGNFDTETVKVFYKPSLRMSNDDYISSLIEMIWSKKVQEASKRGVPMYDGRLFRLYDYRVDGNTLSLYLGDTSYKEYVGTRDKEFYESYGREALANPLAVCAALVSSDGKILVAKRQIGDIYQNHYHVIGGFFDRDLDIKDDGTPNPFEAIKREIYEEIGLEIPISRFRLLGLAYDLITPHPELCFCCSVDLTMSEITRRYSQAKTDAEIDAIEYIQNSETGIKQFVIANHGNISVTGEACLLLFGGYLHGEEWFTQLLDELAAFGELLA